MRNLWLVARRELLARGRSGAYIATTVLMMVMLLAATILPTLLERKGNTAPMDVLLLDRTGKLEAPLRLALDAAAKQPGARQVNLTAATGDEESLTEQVRKNGKQGILIVDGTFPTDLRARFLSASPSVLTSSPAVLGPLEGLVRQARIQARGLDPQVAMELLKPLEAETKQLTEKGGERDQNAFMGSLMLAMGVIMSLYMVILINGQFVFQGVLEEKVSRVVEVMAASVGPGDMLAGKVMGLGALGLIQFLAMIASWIVGNFVAGKITDVPAQGVSLGVAILSLVFLIMGYIMSATLMAAAASTISRMEDQQTVLTPVSLIMALPMFFLASVIGQPNGQMATVLSLIPLFSPQMMVFRVMLSEVPVWQIIASLVLTALMVVFTTWAAGKIYRASMLSYGARRSMKQVLEYLRG